jgi:hypothetical protein
MEIFDDPADTQRIIMSQLPQVERAVVNCAADFKDRTKLSYALIFPIMQATAVRLYVQDFGVAGALTHFEGLVKMLTDDGTIRHVSIQEFWIAGDSPAGLTLHHRAKRPLAEAFE